MSLDADAPFTSHPDVARVTEHGMDAIRVCTQRASGLVYLQGAHLAEWQPAGHEPVIWMSPHALYAPGKALRGGVPICFPWFGPHAEQPQYPAHGFARTRDFRYGGARDHNGQCELEFLLESDSATRALFDFEFSARLRVAIGQELGLEFSVTNRDRRPFAFEEALHSYFRVADVTQAAVRGLQGAEYTDKVRAQAVFRETAAELRLEAETDRVYVSASACVIDDPTERRSIRVDKEHSAATVVWNPWAEKAQAMSDLGAGFWQGMLCLESANVGQARIRLAPGETHILRVMVSVARNP